MPEKNEKPHQEFSAGNPEFKLGQRIFISFLKRKGTVEGVKSGSKAGVREVYDILLDEPLTLGGSDREHSFDYDQITKLEE